MIKDEAKPDELITMINECLKSIDSDLHKSYLINILTYPPYKNKTIKEVLETEIKAKRELI